MADFDATTRAQEENDDLGWAFRVMLEHHAVVRRPSDPAAWRKGIRRLAREQGLSIRTMPPDDGVCSAYKADIDSIPMPHDAATRAEADRAREETNRHGGWNWDDRLRRPDLKPAD